MPSRPKLHQLWRRLFGTPCKVCGHYYFDGEIEVDETHAHQDVWRRRGFTPCCNTLLFDRYIDCGDVWI